jgi:hypothetical protein
MISASHGRRSKLSNLGFFFFYFVEQRNWTHGETRETDGGDLILSKPPFLFSVNTWVGDVAGNVGNRLSGWKNGGLICQDYKTKEESHGVSRSWKKKEQMVEKTQQSKIHRHTKGHMVSQRWENQQKVEKTLISHHSQISWAWKSPRSACQDPRKGWTILD